MKEKTKNQLPKEHFGNPDGQFAVHEPQRLNPIAKSQVGGSQLDQPNLDQENTRTIMQALHGCRKNCAECRQEEAEWAKEVNRGY